MLISVPIKGVAYYSAPRLHAQDALRVGQAVAFTPQPTNPHDANAVSISTSEGLMLGHVARERARLFRSLLANGLIGRAGIGRIEGRNADLRLTVDVTLNCMGMDGAHSLGCDVTNSPGVYQISCQRTGEIYVGSAENVAARVRQHFEQLSAVTHHNVALQVAYLKCGGEAFSVSTLEHVGELPKLRIREAVWVRKLKGSGSRLFNSTDDGQGRKPTPKRKAPIPSKVRYNGPLHRNQIYTPRYPTLQWGDIKGLPLADLRKLQRSLLQLAAKPARDRVRRRLLLNGIHYYVEWSDDYLSEVAARLPR